MASKKTSENTKDKSYKPSKERLAAYAKANSNGVRVHKEPPKKS